MGLIALVLLVSASVVSDPPSWIANPSNEYPPDRYLVGVGSGETEEAAIDDARATLAEAFRAQVTATTSLEDRVEETVGADGRRFDRKTTLNSSMRVVATADIPNMTLASVWSDGNERHYALVVVDRIDASAVLAADLADHKSEIQRLLDTAASNRAPVAAYRASHRAASLCKEYESLASQYRVVTRGKPISPLGTVHTDVDAWHQNTLARLTLTIALAAPDLIAALRDALTGAGFSVVRTGGHFVAELSYSSAESPGTDRFVFERWALSLRILSKTDSTELITINHGGRAGHNSRQPAQERALRQAREMLAGQVKDELVEFLTGGESPHSP